MDIAIVSAFRDRIYRTVAIGNAVSMVGIWMQKIAVGWLAWDLSHSTFWLGLVTAADLVPAVFLSSICGVLADRYDKVLLMRGAQAAAALQSFLLAGLLIAGQMNVQLLFVLTLALGVANSLDHPARLSLLRDIVPVQYLPAAITFNSFSFNIARFVGPMIAGLTMSFAGITVCFVLTGAAIGYFFLALLTLPVRKRPARGLPPGVFGGLGESFRYIARHRSLRETMVVMGVFGMGVNGINQMLPALADRYFGRGVDGFIQLTVAAGLGAVTAGLVLLLLPGGRARLMGMRACLFLAAAAMVAIAFAPHYAFGVLAVFAMCFASTQAGIEGQSTLNRECDPAILGRVMGSYSALIRGAPAAGGFLLGYGASYLPFWPLLLACALMTAACGLWLRGPGR
ncbi:MFS transporter [Pseudooceanicola sp. 216_PA32_1]|uniref:MFS transporter n=1 Tax=Pseudooceanicola pacificus TaxID=2676438 RepID=A0A844WEW2_9RHOB|nr:MFS transporter [Pseudooceanicola pacificus]MWB78690.1 MFS transporter [Pseudooceanicola pacificus]